MNSRNIILSGAILAVIAVLTVAVQPALANPVYSEPNPNLGVYLLKKTFDICDQHGDAISDNAQIPGGAVPSPSGTLVGETNVGGCVDLYGDRLNEYLFTGEQVGILVAVRDNLGAADIVRADLTVGVTPMTQCIDISSRARNADLNDSGKWYGHDVSGDLAVQPPAQAAAQKNGFNPAFDKLYECFYTAQESDSGTEDVTVVVDSTSSGMAASVPDEIYFNPAVSVDVFTSDGSPVSFPPVSSGQTVYSTNTLKILNDGDGGVDLLAWIAGTDLTSSTTPALCPITNALDVEKYMDYRCKIGTIFNNPWHDLPNPNGKTDCDKWDCQGAQPLMPDVLKNDKVPSVLMSGHTAECWFSLTYPTPCIGTFDQGEILVFARAI